MRVPSGQLKVLVPKGTSLTPTRDPRDDLPDIGDDLTPWERTPLQRLSPLPKEHTGDVVGTLCRAGRSC
jgi:hypothetical protein